LKLTLQIMHGHAFGSRLPKLFFQLFELTRWAEKSPNPLKQFHAMAVIEIAHNKISAVSYGKTLQPLRFKSHI